MRFLQVSVAAPARAARRHAESAAADAAALGERRRLHELSRQRRAYFVDQAARAGIDLFRIFDSLNWVENMRVAIDAVRESGKLCEAAICYTGNLNDPRRTKYDLKYYVTLARSAARRCAYPRHQGHGWPCQPRAAFALVKALKEDRPADPFPRTTPAASLRRACANGRGRRGRCRRRARCDERPDVAAESRLDRRGAAPRAARYA